MKRAVEIRHLLLFIILTVALLQLAGSVSSAELQGGGTRSGTSIWHEVGGVGRLNITPEIAKVGERVLYEYANYTAFSQGLNITLRFKNDEGYVDVVEVLREVQKPTTTYNISVEQLFNPENSSFYNKTTLVNTTTTTISVKEWVNVPAISYVAGNDYYYTAQFFIGEQVRYKPKAKTYGGLIKYDTILHPSMLSPTQQIRVEIDPVLNATAANVTSNDGLNITGKCQPNCAYFVDGKIIGGAGNKSNLTGWDTYTDNELQNNPSWSIFNMTNVAHALNAEITRADNGVLNITTQAGPATTVWTSVMRTGNISIPTSGIAINVRVNSTLWTSSSFHPLICFDISYDRLANGTTFYECNMPSTAGSKTLMLYYEAAVSAYRLASIDGGSATPFLTFGSTNAQEWEQWTLYINKTHIRAVIKRQGGGTSDSGLLTHGMAGVESGQVSLDVYNGIIDTYQTVLFDNFSISNTTTFGQPINLTPAVLETGVINSTIVATSVKVTNLTGYYAPGSSAKFQIFDGNHNNTQFTNEGSFNSTIASITGVGGNITLFPPDGVENITASEFTSFLYEWNEAGGGGGGVNVSLPSVNVSLFNGTSDNATAILKSEQLFFYANYSNNLSLTEENSTFKWWINNTNQSQGGNRTAELVPMIYKGAIGYWHLDESGGGSNYTDSAKGLPASITGSAGMANMTGIIRSGVNFGGSTNTYINLGNPMDFSTSNFSISFWSYSRGYAPGGSVFNVMIGRGSIAAAGGTPNALGFGFAFTNNNLTAWRVSQNASTIGSSLQFVEGWHHHVGTYDTTNQTAEYYFDGKLVSRFLATQPTADIGFRTDLLLGVDNQTTSRRYRGLLDEVALYNRTLTAVEAKQLYLRTWYDHSPQLFLLQPYKNNSTGLNSSDGEKPTTIVNAANATGYYAGTYGVNLTPNGYLNYSASGNFNEREGTIEFWVKPEWNGNDNLAHVFFNTETAADFNFSKTTGNDLAVYFGSPGSAIARTSISGLTSGSWKYIAMTWNNYTGNVTLHVDGLEVNNSGTAFVIPTFRSFLIGAMAPGTSDFANATISEFRISRKALTAQEISLSYSKGRAYYQNEYLLNSSNYMNGDALRLEYLPKDSNRVSGNLTNSSAVYVTDPSSASEAEGDTAIELGINSSLPSATKYNEQQVYVRNLSNNQTLGTFDWVAAFGNQRWLFNYVTTGESYVRAPNLTTAVYVLEIADKTSAQITDEVSRFINATKS